MADKLEATPIDGLADLLRAGVHLDIRHVLAPVAALTELSKQTGVYPVETLVDWS